MEVWHADANDANAGFTLFLVAFQSFVSTYHCVDGLTQGVVLTGLLGINITYYNP